MNHNAITIALRRASAQLADHASTSSREIREHACAAAEDVLSNGPMPLCSVKQIALRFICEELSEYRNVRADKLEDEFIQEAVERLKGEVINVCQN